jgi:hypothetical protein
MGAVLGDGERSMGQGFITHGSEVGLNGDGCIGACGVSVSVSAMTNEQQTD